MSIKSPQNSSTSKNPIWSTNQGKFVYFFLTHPKKGSIHSNPEEFLEKISQLQELIGYKFKNQDHLLCALTHRSSINLVRQHCNKTTKPMPAENIEWNERLEFLGDAVLDFSISALLWDCYPGADEGKLSKIRSALVNEKALAGNAHEIQLNVSLLVAPQLGRNLAKTSESNIPASLMADAFEALIGGIFLDSNAEETQKVIARLFKEQLVTPMEEHLKNDPKTLLQELFQSQKTSPPRYVVLKSSGKAHKKLFHVGVYSSDSNLLLGEGQGTSLKKAQQDAAGEALRKYVSPISTKEIT